MTLFLPQQRVLLNEDGVAFPAFPSPVTASIDLAPEDAFGVEGAAERRVISIYGALGIGVDLNEGKAWREGQLIEPLELAQFLGDVEITLTGNHLVLSYEAESVEDAVGVATSASALLPATLTLRPGVYVWIKRFLLS